MLCGKYALAGRRNGGIHIAVWRLSLLFGAWTLSAVVFTLWNTVGDAGGYFVDGVSVLFPFLSNKLLVYSVPVLLYQLLTEFGADSFRRAAAFDPRVIFDARYNIWNSDFKMFTWALAQGGAAWLLLGFAGMLQSKRRI